MSVGTLEVKIYINFHLSVGTLTSPISHFHWTHDVSAVEILFDVITVLDDLGVLGMML
jgi:hypothetical protein